MTQRGDQTRANLIDAAATLFEQRGYHATGVKAILELSQAPRGSFYFHFPGGKEELALAALERGEQVISQTLAASASLPTLLEVFGASIDALAARLVDSDYNKSCPVTIIALEAADESPVLTRACDDAFRMWVSQISALLIAHGWPPEPASERAELMLASLEGALILARVRRSRAPLDLLKRQLPTLLTI